MTRYSDTYAFYLAGKSWWNNMSEDERDAALRAAGTDRVDEAYRWWLENRVATPAARTEK